MDYNPILGMILVRAPSRQSARLRYSLRSAHRFSSAEFENYMILGWRWGLVERSRYREVNFGPEKKPSYDGEAETLCLTKEGWEFLDANDRPIIHVWDKNLSENLPTVIISVLSAIGSASALYYFGFTK